VEILDRETSVTDEQAAEYFFRDLADANGIVSADGIQYVKSLTPPEMPTPTMDQNNDNLPSNDAAADVVVVRGGIGRQLVAQGRDTDIAGNPRNLDTKWVRIDLCVIRLPSVATDLLITLTTPGELVPQATMEHLDGTFITILQSFRIVDWTLFGE